MSHSLRIGIDMAATAGQKSGLGFYVDHIVTGMKQISGGHEIVEIKTIHKNLRTPARILWDQFGLPTVALFKNVDVLFVPAFSAPRFTKPVIMTAHDIFGVIHPEYFSASAKLYWKYVLPQSMKDATHLLCISEHTKQDIMNHLHIPEQRLSVVPLAASERFRVMHDQQTILRHVQEFSITRPFILTVGTLEPRKNYDRLIEAFAHAKRDATQLVIVGKRAWGFHKTFELVKKYHLQKSVVFLDYVDEDQLISLYNACIFFIMPSFYEGFGLPALEAMQCGAPVAVSQNTSLPEVVGHAGVLFDPYDIDMMRDRMSALLHDAPMLQTMKQQSLHQAQKFSWQKTAEQTLNIIHRIISIQ